MALTVDEIVAAVNAVPGITADAITKTLTVGGLTTAMSQIDDRVALLRAQQQADRDAAEAEIVTLTAQRSALAAQRQALLK